MTKYVLPIDTSCEKRSFACLDRMEKLLDKYSVKPLSSKKIKQWRISQHFLPTC